MPRIALFQPDLAPNVGLVIRTAACLGLPVDVIEPCGFPFSMKAVRVKALDYAEHAIVARHASWEAFVAKRTGRLVALTTKGSQPLWDTVFQADDILLAGQESAGLPAHVHAAADLAVRIPMAPGLRSMNVAIAVSIVAAEATRQLR